MSGAHKGTPRLLLVCGGIVLLCALLLAVTALRSGDDEAPADEAPAAAALPEADRAYLESGEYAAAAAWESFRADYDSDGSVFNAFLTGGGAGIDRKYELYSVYSPEMADALEKLITEHALGLHESISYFYAADELYAAAGTGSFLLQDSGCVGYLYGDGSFHFDGSAYLSGSITADYRFERQMRGIFAEETLNTGRGEGWQSWSMESEDGTLLHLALGESECVIHAALEDSFVSVTTLSGAATAENPGGLTAAALEELAGRFVWSELKAK